MVFVLPLNHADIKRCDSGASIPLSHSDWNHSECSEVLLFDWLIFEKISKHYDEVWLSRAPLRAFATTLSCVISSSWGKSLSETGHCLIPSICRQQAQRGADRSLRWFRNTVIDSRD